jgi:hypothetical protein
MRGARLNRQTFEGVARAIRRVIRDAPAPAVRSRDWDMFYDGVQKTAEALADDFAEAANNFDRQLFLKNCGFEEQS